uniref:Uncharacterized protein n=1 Tax=Anguilla anguilla TaxID=7936 RepID=A0A0E9TCY5_ANGAN
MLNTANPLDSLGVLLFFYHREAMVCRLSKVGGRFFYCS